MKANQPLATPKINPRKLRVNKKTVSILKSNQINPHYRPTCGCSGLSISVFPECFKAKAVNN